MKEPKTMTHHACSPRRLVLHAVALAALVATASCSGDDNDGDGSTVTALRVIVNAVAPVRGIQVDLRHDSDITVTDIDAGAALSGANCTDNVTSGRVQFACASNTNITSPFTAVTIEVIHDPAIEPLDSVTSISCLAADSTGAPVTATCTVE